MEVFRIGAVTLTAFPTTLLESQRFFKRRTAGYSQPNSDSFVIFLRRIGLYLRGWTDYRRREAERHIISKRCIIEYIWQGIFRASFKFCMGDKLREEMEGYKRDVSFNVHTPLQIVFLQNFENCRLPFKNETLHQ